MTNSRVSSPVQLTRTVPFTSLPKTSALQADYAYAPERLDRFFEHRWDGVDSLERIAPDIAARAVNRESVADVLAAQNRMFGSSERTFEHIELLRHRDAVAVVTGQQAGLFGGPLFTIYKALTAIELAARLRERGTPAVPVFWIASEDHDFEEVNHTTVAARGAGLATVRVEPCAYEPDRPVGHVTLCAEIGQWVDELFEKLPRTIYTEQLRSDLNACYAPSAGFAEGFARLMARLFAPFGVILLDPLRPEMKALAAPTYARAIERTPEIAEALVHRSEELVAAGYHAQVFTSPDMVPLLVLDEGRRRAMVRRDGRFELKAGGASFSEEELLEFAGSDPERLSPNVTLRPVVQDTLLPTVGYVGGPAEVAYFAQIHPVYAILDRPMPVIVPRASATIVDRDTRKTLERYGLSLEELVGDRETRMRHIVERSLEGSTAALFDETESNLARDLDRLRAALEASDPTLASSLDGSRRKMFYQVNKLRNRFIRAAAGRDETLRRRLEMAEAFLHPQDVLQERVLNVFSYLVLTGYGIVEDLAEVLDPECRDHQVIDLGGIAGDVMIRA